MIIPDPDFFTFWIPDQRIKKAPHPGSGSATLIHSEPLDANQCCGCILIMFGLEDPVSDFDFFVKSGSWFLGSRSRFLMTKN
jgi:hypothetical protein